MSLIGLWFAAQDALNACTEHWKNAQAGDRKQFIINLTWQTCFVLKDVSHSNEETLEYIEEFMAALEDMKHTIVGED